MQGSSIRIIAAIPAYNEENKIAKTLILAEKYVDRIIVCNDGSSDLTGEIAEELGAEVITHPRNMGYGAALTSLFTRAQEEGADILVTLDGDGQHDPTEISRVIEPLARGDADVVIGSRFLDAKTRMPRYRRAGVRGLTKMSDAMSYDGLTDAQSGFRAYNKKALENLVPAEMGMGASTEILSRAKESGLRVTEVPINVSYGPDSSTHSPIYHGLDVMLALVKHLSIRHPLLFYGVPGFAIFLLGLGFGLWTIGIYTASKTISATIALVAVAGTMMGLLLMTSAIILWVLVTVVRSRE